MAKRVMIEWFGVDEKRPPKNERLLLIVSAAGEPPDAQLMDKCEIAIGYWDGNDFRPVTLAPHDSPATFKVRHWATLRNEPENKSNMRKL
jgi:hypothetical protein